MSRLEKSARTVELIEWRLAHLRKAYEAGVIVAVPAALDYCIEHDFEPPRWLVQAALDHLCDLLKREKSTKRGRAAGALARYRQDRIDFLRWNEVEVLRGHQKMSIETVAEHAADPSQKSSPSYEDEVMKAEWLGTSLSTLFQCTSEILERTDAFGSPESIKRSYLRVRRSDKDPAQASRYCWLPDPFLWNRLNIDNEMGYGQHAKIAAWRDSPRCKGRKLVRKRAR